MRDPIQVELDALRAKLEEQMPRRRCSAGHEQDPLWSVCRLCQLEAHVEELAALLPVGRAALQKRSSVVP